MKRSRVLSFGLVASMIAAAMSTAAANDDAGSASIGVTPVRSSPGYGSFVLITIDGPSGLTTTFGSIGNETVFAGLDPGTYDIEVSDFGGIIDDPQAGSASVTVAADEFAQVTVELQSVGFPFPGPPIFPF